MIHSRFARFPILLLGLILIASPAVALINPRVQPKDIYDRSLNVISCKVTAVDTKALRVEFEVEGTTKGSFSNKKVVMQAATKENLLGILALQVGERIVAFAGKERPASARQDVLYYVGEGHWYLAKMDPADAGQWELVGNADEGKSSSDIWFGVFNGSVANLWLMMQDTAAGKLYFPATPSTTFSSKTLGKLEQPGSGIAILDLDGNGSLDIVVASPGGSRAYSQEKDGNFTDQTEAWGLSGIAGQSVSWADANGDGSPDLLLDGVLYLQSDGKMKKADLLPVLPGVTSGSFVELNGDGFPDVVVSVPGAGLSAFQNTFSEKPGTPPSFTNITKAVGLDLPTAGAGGTGYFETGDWDRDGRTDLIYLAGPGYLLLNTSKGFEPAPLPGAGDSAYATASIAPIVTPTDNSAIVLVGDSKRLLQSIGAGMKDVTRFGNEIRDDIPGLFTIVADDLNADGNIDFYAAAKEVGSTSFYCENRGYGSFMMPVKYSQDPVFPAEVANAGVRGMATADLDGDGAIDIVLTGIDGTIWLLHNESLARRPEQPEPATTWTLRKQIGARIATVRAEGKTGVVGAWLSLTNEHGEVSSLRQISGNIGVGCAGPHEVIFTVREPGRYTLTAKFADGFSSTLPLNLGAEMPRHQIVTVKKPLEGKNPPQP